MPNFTSFSRRHFVALCGISALLMALPALRVKPESLSGDAAWEAVENSMPDGRSLLLTGHLKKISDSDYVLSRVRHHCDYCYTGHAASVVTVGSAAPLSEGASVTL